MRRITVTIRDEKTDTSVRGETTLDMVNEIYEVHGLNALTDITQQLNDELNKELKVIEKFLPE